jgi:hypothetical protein
MDMQKWWYELHGEQKGPITYPELQALLQQNTLHPNNMVWTEGFATWIRVADLAGTTQSQFPLALSFAGLDAYYRTEFAKIHQSSEQYKGQWNWWAFLFSPIWAFSKKLWALGLIIFLGAVVLSFTHYGLYLLYTLGWAIVMGLRGNYFYYNLLTKNKQL